MDTGSSIKNNTLTGSDSFDVKDNPYIAFRSTRIVQTGPDTFELDGNFTVRGVTKTEKLAPTVFGKGTGSGEIRGRMALLIVKTSE